MARTIPVLLTLTLCAACTKNTPPTETAAHPGDPAAAQADPDALPEPEDSTVLDESRSDPETKD